MSFLTQFEVAVKITSISPMRTKETEYSLFSERRKNSSNFSNTIGPLGLATHYPKWRRFGAPTSLFMQLAR